MLDIYFHLFCKEINSFGACITKVFYAVSSRPSLTPQLISCIACCSVLQTSAHLKHLHICTSNSLTVGFKTLLRFPSFLLWYFKTPIQWQLNPNQQECMNKLQIKVQYNFYADYDDVFLYIKILAGIIQKLLTAKLLNINIL